MTVRAFTEADFPAVCGIYADAKQDELQFESGEFAVTPLDQDTAILAAFNESTVLVFEDKEVLGFAALHENQLRALFVRRNVRNQGVGQALLDKVLSMSTAGITLNVAASNIGARKFYLRNGFSVAGEVERTYQDKAISYLQMASPAKKIRHEAGL
ncbi:GNAT family N-acetyltransferase [Duganella sp. FT80W]|uniref:GNAT family N-acetyltransferase n=1 Tax=Duganella guangzhouensis TaxID=2666084 RepID=A0A6I2LC95_9BURK|nr:GNAT family N-acetyltransferase [Duganella guangzhouensis]MRW93879.1 GNAT family N-acetyltransferase [Duganella guangzhouensis]